MSRKDGKWWRDKHGVYNTRWIAIFNDDPKPVKIVFHSSRDYMEVGCPIVISGSLFRVTKLQGKRISLHRSVPRPLIAYPGASIL